jgi:DNA-binding response OmpR family regulator
LSQGAYAYLTKPYDPREVVAALHAAIAARATRKEP